MIPKDSTGHIEGPSNRRVMRTLPIAGLVLGLGISSSDAGPCSNDIELIANEMSQSDDNDINPIDRRPLGTKSDFPSARGMSLAKMKADPRFIAAMERARSLDDEGNPACMKLVREMKNLISE
jgi:hypothetical protein